jgi:ABC-type transport system involved in multi-copper enzyme maturation permease subunit
MIATLFAEFRKLLSVRSTYIVSILSLVLGGFIAFWGIGYKGGPEYPPTTLQHAALEITSIVGIFVGIIAILVICHEYRYSTISYTLTASNSRFKVLLAKFISVGAYALIMTLVTIALSIGLTILGAKIAGNDLGTQSIDLFALLWRTLGYMIGGAWLGLILGFLSRSLVFAIVAYFVIPAIEPLIHNLLKVSNNYLPSASQSQILQTTTTPDTFSAAASLGVFAIYLAGGFIVATYLFIKRDAS